MAERIIIPTPMHKKVIGIFERNANSQRVVIIVHGYDSSKEGTSAKQISSALAQKNIATFRIDLPGCGESDGEFKDKTISEDVIAISGAIEEMKKRQFSEICLFGNSMGGLASMVTSLKHPELHKLALKAPVSDLPEQAEMGMHSTGDVYDIAAFKRRGFTRITHKDGSEMILHYPIFEDSQKYIMYDIVSKISVPTLVVHGTADEIVDVQFTKNLMKKFDEGSCILLDGANHGLEINGDASESITIFTQWLTK
ncbi:MAG: alpha/beta hydrolase family protein [Candidatus Woesearchaeota archaeon]